MNIEIAIWIGLIANGYEKPPPHRLLANEELEAADKLRSYWKHYNT